METGKKYKLTDKCITPGGRNMTRDEEIKCASKDYVNYLLDKQEYHNEDYTEDDIRQAFENGAMFADRNPDLSSLWHDASDEPKEDMYILFISKNGKVHKVSKIDNSLYDWLKDNDGIDKWAYISDLLPKGGK